MGMHSASSLSAEIIKLHTIDCRVVLKLDECVQHIAAEKRLEIIGKGYGLMIDRIVSRCTKTWMHLAAARAAQECPICWDVLSILHNQVAHVCLPQSRSLRSHAIIATADCILLQEGGKYFRPNWPRGTADVEQLIIAAFAVVADMVQVCWSSICIVIIDLWLLLADHIVIQTTIVQLGDSFLKAEPFPMVGQSEQFRRFLVSGAVWMTASPLPQAFVPPSRFATAVLLCTPLLKRHPSCKQCRSALWPTCIVKALR